MNRSEKCTGYLWEVDANCVCFSLLILHLQRLGLGRVWARPAGHQFCGHIHLHLGHQVRISMFLRCREIGRLLSIISRFQGEARTDGCCSSAVLAGAPSASHSLKADLCSPTFKTVQRQRRAAEWYIYAAVVLLIGKSTNWLYFLPHSDLFSGAFPGSQRCSSTCLDFFTWMNKHHFVILQPFSNKFSDCCGFSLSGGKSGCVIQEPFPVRAFPYFPVLSIMSNFRLTDLSKPTSIKTPRFAPGAGTAGFSCWLYSSSLWPPASHFVPLCLLCSIIIGG